MHPPTTSFGFSWLYIEEAVNVPPMLLIKFWDRSLDWEKNREYLKTIRFGVLGRELVSFEDQAMNFHSYVLYKDTAKPHKAAKLSTATAWWISIFLWVGKLRLVQGERKNEFCHFESGVGCSSHRSESSRAETCSQDPESRAACSWLSQVLTWAEEAERLQAFGCVLHPLILPFCSEVSLLNKSILLPCPSSLFS